MTKQRIRELRAIAAGLYVSALEAMSSGKYGHVKQGAEETIVMSELAHKIVADVAVWTIEDHTKEE